MTHRFRENYLFSLHQHKSFYDDLYEYGNINRADYVFYFVPGFNGVPGQIRFALPSLIAYFGPDIYVRCLYIEEFSAKRPIWEKYNESNVLKRRRKIVDDINELTQSHGDVTVIVSSSGFYDFLAAFQDFSETTKTCLKVAWVACAPDWSDHSAWEKCFFKLGGLEYNGHRWFAYPNHNWMTFINQECDSKKRWKCNGQKKTFYKADLESRFWLGGLMWDYFSFGCYNWLTEFNISASNFPIDIPAGVLVATNDGYWLGKSEKEIESVVFKYLTKPKFIYRKTTHLWVIVPENITAMAQLLYGSSSKS